MALSQSERLKLIEAAVFSIGDTLTEAEALSLIASVFRGDPGTRINKQRLAELLNVVTPPRRRAKRIG
jgi:hypothetical protein